MSYKPESRQARRIHNLRYVDDTTVMAESEEELKNVLLRVKEESESTSLRLNIKKNEDHGIRPHYCMANGRGKRERSDRFPLPRLQDHCGWWLQPWNQMIAPWQESDDKARECVEKQRHYSANKGPYSQGYGLLRVTNSCECWSIKKAEHQRTDAFKLWC